MYIGRYEYCIYLFDISIFTHYIILYYQIQLSTRVFILITLIFDVSINVNYE